jgi:hypothetical protein
VSFEKLTLSRGDQGASFQAVVWLVTDDCGAKASESSDRN